MAGSADAANVISLPTGGGALSSIGEKFSPDLHTGTGNFTFPISLPPGRNGFQPQLNLSYSTGNGNGPIGLGWNFSVPGVSRKTSKGNPRYDDHKDTFILSGAEDLVAVETIGTTTRYRPRTEGLFAQIFYHRDAANNYWEVRSKDGIVSYYGTPDALGSDPATIANPSRHENIFAWKLTRTEDLFGNRIEYEYIRDSGREGPHDWDQLNLAAIRYVDYTDQAAHSQFLVSVEFAYELRPDPYSEYRSGFEIRSRKRCTSIVVHIHPDAHTDQTIRTYDFTYLDQVSELSIALPLNGVSLLSHVKVTGRDADQTETLPTLEFSYTGFEPQKRNFFPLQGDGLPAHSLADPNLEPVDLFGNGLPDLIEMNGTVRYWRNLGGGCFDLPQFMHEAPVGLALSDPGVQFMDANGDGRTDLLVTTEDLSGYFPLRFGGHWDRHSFQRYAQAPSFSLKDPEVRLVDLDGDGVTDAIRSGSRFECFFNDPREGWNSTRRVQRQALDLFPNVNFSDSRVKWADLTGDGLQDIALIHDGNVEYWPNLGYGNWGHQIHMENSPRFPYGYDPRRILVGDVDGDGLADIVYVENTRVTLWINQSGNRWSNPLTIEGTPPVSDTDAIRLVDIMGSGISGVLWSRDADGSSRDQLFFFDFTSGLKPYLLNEIDNHTGAVTKVGYSPSTRFYLEDQNHAHTRWKTTLPFVVHVVARVEMIDHFSGGKLTSEYRYHHGYWDGDEREFRGFGMVEQLDTESFVDYSSRGLHGAAPTFASLDQHDFSPPTLARTWFHQGPVGDAFSDWQELDWSDQYWSGDPQLLKHTETANRFLQSWSPSSEGRRIKRDALRALRGSILRSELYALDHSEREQRPYTVNESSYGLVEFEPPAAREKERKHIFFPHITFQRTTQWERGDDPMTQFSLTRYTDENHAATFDPFGRPRVQTQVACPRRWRNYDDRPAEPYLVIQNHTVYADSVDPQVYLHNRVAKTSSYEFVNTHGMRVIDFAGVKESSAELKLIGQTLNFYDGAAFVGLPLGKVGKFGAVSRTENLVFTDEILERVYGAEIPPYLQPNDNVNWTADYPAEFRTLLPRRAGYSFHAGSATPADPKGYFITTNRCRYDFQSSPSATGRGLVLETHDPLYNEMGNESGHRTLIAYDLYQFMPKQVTDAAGLVMQAVYDYRVMQPAEVTDVNGNQMHYSFSPLGFLKSSRVRGKAPTEGDQNRDSMRLEYDFLAFENSPIEHRQPIFVRTIRHIHHDTELDIALPERDATIMMVEYSDGFGRLLQTRNQAEDVCFGAEHFGGGESVLPAKQSDGAGGDVIGRVDANDLKPNVVVSGWQIYDNKGQVIEKYEPFFSQGWDYRQPDHEANGQKVALFYDPRGQVIRTLNPDGSEQRVIYGVPGSIASPDLSHPSRYEPTPWEAYTYDANDSAGRTHPTTSGTYRHHWDTPSSIIIDALGRAIEAIARNRDVPDHPNDPLSPIQEIRTRMTYDIRGNLLTLTDALGRKAFQHIYDFANRNLRTDSIDAGQSTTVLDAGGAVVEEHDGKGAFSIYSYDGLNRPLRFWARDSEGQVLTLRERLEYGDASSPNQSASDRTANQAANRLGRLSRYFDEAGLTSFESYDFKGNLLEKTRRVISDAAILSVFNGPPLGWQIDTFRADWTSLSDSSLDAEGYASSVRYDALNRMKLITYSEDVENRRRNLRPHYNRAGALEAVLLEKVTPDGGVVSDTFVERIAYNAKGQRVMIAYGNGIMTRYAYTPDTFRLLHLRTERYSKPAPFTYRHGGALQQELAYEYDLAGNVLKIHDLTPECGIQNTPLGDDALDREFTYDALYRLRAATGRECDHPPDLLWDERARCADLTMTRSYTEAYIYDVLGNIESLKHGADDGSFTRTFARIPANNRLKTLSIGPTDFDYQYDANGNMTREGTSRHFEWDHADRMCVYRTQVGASEPTVHTHYLYDAAGKRIKKLVRKQGGLTEVTVYIDGGFEHQRIVQGGTVEQNNTLHVTDGETQIALVRIGTPFADDATPAVKYHLGDHLGSSSLVIDADANWVNREEYTPYGETSFGSFARKRYRFSGKEKDEESGLSYFGFRYYAPWLGRWMSCDPAGTVDGPNLYAYVSDNPIRLTDAAGLNGSGMDSGGGVPPPDTSGIPNSDYGTGAGASSAGGTMDYERWVPDYDNIPSVDASNLPPVANTPPPTPTVAATVAPMAVPWTYAPSSTDMYTPVQTVDTGSELGNYGLAIWASWCNVLTMIPNAAKAVEADIGDAVMSAARSVNADQDLRNAQVLMPTMAIEQAAIMAPEAIQAAITYAGQAPRAIAFAFAGMTMGGGALTRTPRTTYIIYAFMDATGVRYIGRASGYGTPEQVMMARITKGHDTWNVFAEALDLQIEILGTQKSRAANMGAEAVLHDQYLSQGRPLLNSDKSPPLSMAAARIANTYARILAYLLD